MTLSIHKPSGTRTMMNYHYYFTKVLMIFLATDDWDKLKSYSDSNFSVLGLELLQTSLFIQCTKRLAESGDRNYSNESRPQTDQTNGESLTV